ncbi:MAG: 23S rRNA pseudouridine(1911/1915/1917) synthase RluD [Gammaproteobacteria bacterium]|nr:MAG: 23S rRNA pseudouridine(1911/1915/1917) synthase RluD [Gammaproteobacteria bacterium]RLA33190.1 MAG: 23S rRNA pseudouridine(1911/1915/1917) synthase RluD [Gammaproteobacteria bacterium]
MTIPSEQKTVPLELAGQRLDQALAQMFPQFSRSRLKTWILQGFVTVDERKMRPRDAVSGGESIVLLPQAEIAVISKPEPLDLDIVYEDEDLLVVNKPAGLVVHPGAGNTRGTLMNGLLHRVPALEQLPRAGIIHRLDKETSGLLLVGKNLEAHTALVRKLADRDISRHYLAVCNGVLTGGGKIDAPIARHPTERVKMSVQSKGKPAITHYRVLQRFAAHTYISVQLETGRTHQIRVHFAHRRNALVGDQVYGGRLAMPAGASAELQDVLRQFRRQALHATRLAFSHPRTGADVECQVEPPDDFSALIAALKKDAEQRD